MDTSGDTIEFLLSKYRNKQAAKRFFKKMLSNQHIKQPRAIAVDKNQAYPPAIKELKEKNIIPKKCKLRL